MKKSTLFYVIAILCGLIAAIMGASYISDSKKETQIVVVTKDLPAYASIKSSDVSVVSIPLKAVPSDAIKSVQDAVGQYTSISIQADSPLRQGALLKGADRPAGILAKKNDNDLVLVSVPLQGNDLGSGLQQGDHINLFGISKSAGKDDKTIVINNLEIIKIDGTSKGGDKGPNLWISIPQEKCEELENVIVNGTIRIALLPKGEAR